MRTFRCVALLCAACVLVGAVAKSKPEKLDDRSRCIALLAETLAYAKCQNLNGFLAKIADGVGNNTFKLIPAAAAESLARSEGGAAGKFLAKDVPHASEILQHFQDIKFSELRAERKVRIKTRGGGPSGAGELFVMDIILPKATGADLSKQGDDGHNVYSRVRFVRYANRMYWVPFGW